MYFGRSSWRTPKPHFALNFWVLYYCRIFSDYKIMVRIFVLQKNVVNKHFSPQNLRDSLLHNIFRFEDVQLPKYQGTQFLETSRPKRNFFRSAYLCTTVLQVCNTVLYVLRTQIQRIAKVHNFWRPRDQNAIFSGLHMSIVYTQSTVGQYYSTVSSETTDIGNR